MLGKKRKMRCCLGRFARTVTPKLPIRLNLESEVESKFRCPELAIGVLEDRDRRAQDIVGRSLKRCMVFPIWEGERVGSANLFFVTL